MLPAMGSTILRPISVHCWGVSLHTLSLNRTPPRIQLPCSPLSGPARRNHFLSKESPSSIPRHVYKEQGPVWVQGLNYCIRLLHSAQTSSPERKFPGFLSNSLPSYSPFTTFLPEKLCQKFASVSPIVTFGMELGCYRKILM